MQTQKLRKKLLKKGVHARIATLIESLNHHLSEKSKIIAIDGNKLVLRNCNSKNIVLGNLDRKDPYFIYHSLHFDEKGTEALNIFRSIFASEYVDIVMEVPALLEPDADNPRSVLLPDFEWFTVTFLLKSGKVTEMKFFNEDGDITGYFCRANIPKVMVVIPEEES